MTIDVEALKARVDLRRIAAAAGLELRRAGAGSVKGCCPLHGERTPSFHVWADRFHCFGCQAHGDAVEFVMRLEGLDFRAACERLARDVGADLEAIPAATPPPSAPRTFPPRDAVVQLWEMSSPVCRGPEVAAYLRLRGIDPERVDALELARAAPGEEWLPDWAWCGRTTWTASGHRLLVPLRDHRGIGRSLLARAITRSRARKSIVPAGFATRGLVMLCPRALSFVRGEAPGLRRLVITEGEIKFLAIATRIPVDALDVAVIAVRAGSWPGAAPLAEQLSDGCTVYLATDPDRAGAEYATRILRSLEERWRAGAVAIELRPGHQLTTDESGAPCVVPSSEASPHAA